MRVSEIYLDLDDVLNNFTMSALEEFECNVDTLTDKDYPTDCGYDIVKAANKLLVLSGVDMVSADDFWNTFEADFWAGIEKSREFYDLFTACRDLVGEKSVYVLTAQVSRGDMVADCVCGKVEWILDNLPAWITNNSQYFIGRNKWKVANPWSLLIDDSDENIRLFRAAGGQAITVPRAWNFLAGADTLKHVIGSLKDLEC